MSHRTGRFLAPLFLLAGTLVGCGPSWVVVRQASPNTLAGTRSVYAAPLSWESLSIGGKNTEAEWIAKRDAKDQAQFRADWERDKAEASSIYATRLAANLARSGLTTVPAAGGQTLGIRAHVDIYEPGFWSPAGFGNAATELKVTVDFVVGGTAQDTVQFHPAVGPSVFNPVPGQRCKQAAEQLADQVAAYLTARAR